MYNITAAVKNMFDSNYVQQIRIHMDTVGGGSYDITENSILAGTFSIDRYSVTGSRIELGTAVAGECTFKMKNYDAQWSNVSFEGAQLYVTIRIADWASNPSDSDIAVIPCGYFTIDKPVRNAKILEITALDRMAKFDKLVDTSALAVAYTPRTLIDFCCTQCGVLLANGSELANLPNANYAVSIPENIGELTYRNLLQSACMLLGTCAFIDWNGLLRVMWYTPLNTEGSELLDFGENFWSQTINESSGRQTDFDYSPLSKTIYIDGSSTIGWNLRIGEVTLNAGTYLLTGINRNNRPVDIKLTGTGINAIDSGEGATFTVTDSNTTLMVYLTSPEGDITYDNLEVKPSLYKKADVYPYYTSSKRYSHTIQEKDIEITGVYYAYEDEERVLHEYINGTKDYCLDISDNPFINRETVESAVQALGTALVGFSYRPLTMSVKPAPYLYPMDMFDFVTADGNIVHGIVSKITFGVNARTHIESNGQTNEDNGYATYGNFTSVQSKIIEKAKTQISRVVNERTTMLLNLNEMIANSLGLYVTAVPVTGGGNQYYFHDSPTLISSNIIYTFTSNGLAWTDNWNGGEPVWQYGITRDGNAIVNMLSAYKVSADIISSGVIMSDTGNNYWNLRTGDFYNSIVTKESENVQNYVINPLLTIGTGETVPYYWGIIGSDTAEVVNDAEMGMCWHFISTTAKCGARNNAGAIQVGKSASKVYAGANIKVMQSGHFSDLGYKVRAQLTVVYSDNTNNTIYSAAYVKRLNTAEKVTFEFEVDSTKVINYLLVGFYNTYISTQETTQETYYADMWCSLVDVSDSESFTINATSADYTASTIDYVADTEVGHVLMNDEKAEFVGTTIKGSEIVFAPTANSAVTAKESQLGSNGGVIFEGDGDFTVETATVGITGTGSSGGTQEVQIAGYDGNGNSKNLIQMTDEGMVIRFTGNSHNITVRMSDAQGLRIEIDGVGYSNLGWVNDGNGHAVLGK